MSQRLVAFAEERHATAPILSSQGHGSSPLYRLGGMSERVALTARIPVLVVRDAEPFVAWAQGRRPLRLLLGIDWTASSEPPIRWVRRLAAAGRCHICVAHMYYVNDARRRYGLPPRPSLVEPDPEVERLLTRDLAARVREMGAAGDVTFRAVLGLGRIGDHLLWVADVE